MSVQLEVLDYHRGEGDNMVSFSSGTPTNAFRWKVSPISDQMSDWTGVGLATNTLFKYNGVSLPLQVGNEYRIRLEITNKTGSQNMGVLSVNSAGTANGVGTSVQSTSNTVITHTFTATASGSIICYAYGGNNGTMTLSLFNLTDGIDFDKSTAGVLDVTDHVDFPLALTFQINDIKDITSTSGDYSKTFKIPATKNNNKILHNSFDPKVFDSQITTNKSCRILINNSYSIVGILKVTGISGFGEKASYYECIFYGNNLAWAKGIDNKYLNEIDWGTIGEDIKYHKTEIMETWDDEDCTTSDRPYVYPVVSYGDYNVGGIEKTVQLLDYSEDVDPTYIGSGKAYVGWNNAGTSFGTPPPAADWRPAIYVKTTMEKIFAPLGYSISSDFMNTSMFKKLVWLLPNFIRNNPDDFYNDFSFNSNFINGITNQTDSIGGVPSRNPEAQVTDTGLWKFFLSDMQGIDTPTGTGTDYYTGDNRVEAELDANILNITLGENTTLDATNHYVQIKKSGYYIIDLNGIASRVARIYRTGTQEDQVFTTKSVINLEVKTVGQTSWNIIGSSERAHSPFNMLGNQNVQGDKPSFSAYTTQPSISIGSSADPLYLNFDDKIRITFGYQLSDVNDESVEFVVYHFFKAKAAGSEFSIKIDPNAVAYGQEYNLSDVIDKDYKQVDFIKGVAHAFNLQITTNEVSKQISIEPFDDFYLTYKDAVDWTSKLDRGKEIKDQWTKSNLKRNLLFKYKSDEQDASVKKRGNIYFKGVHDEYPYQEELPLDFEKGNSVYENPFFAGTYNGQDSDSQGDYGTDPAFSACLWNEDTNSASSRNGVRKGNEFLPRLLFYKKYSPTSSHLEKFIKCQTWDSTTHYVYANNWYSGIPSPSTASYLGGIYPQATSINRHDIDSPVLSYGNVYVTDYDDLNNTYAPSAANKGLYDTYYKKMIEMFKSNPRLRTAYIDIKITDITSLNFRKLIYIDGVYWRLNKIIDYFPNKNQSTKVELIQWHELGAFAASAPAFGAAGVSSQYGGGIDPVLSDWNPETFDPPDNEFAG